MCWFYNIVLFYVLEKLLCNYSYTDVKQIDSSF